MNFEQARFNMVEQQIRPWDVLDQTVLDLMRNVARERFVPEPLQRLAYADTEIPLGDGELMMPPRVEARLLQSLQITAGDRALEIGTGSGFVTALLARLARHVTSIEISEPLHARAREVLAAEGVVNVSLEHGDGLRGWLQGAPYDVIAVTGSVPVLEPDMQRQLRLGGRMFVIVGDAPTMEARLITRTGEDEWSTESLFETVVAPLRGAARPQRFVL
ncbi:MAG: protein-L-isoaspartate O-methyltransferase [Ectothiorhodospiraceae bacterium]|nr:protein-L-isoaspartate O-methyltransferase [Chromatiales bacterium]MCP5156983.1 protein-L-isoaspartate O-methyltransferase [Ectothiorhodospiraceae bacterium]